MIRVTMNRQLLKKSEPGFVLIAVLLMVAVLAVIILEFNYESRIRLHLADNWYQAAKALDYAQAGIAISMAALGQKEDILTDDKLNPFFSGMVQISTEEGYCKISITDETGKININSLSASDGTPIRQRVDQMLRLIDLLNSEYGGDSPVSYSLIPAIIDWVDSDDDLTYLSFVTRNNAGAENDYYQNLADPYPCKNAPFDVLGELMLIKGMTSEIFEGRPGDESRDVRPVSGIQQYLTVYGDGKININEASAMVIQSLSEKIDYPLAQNIVEQRKFARYSSIEQLLDVPGMTPDVYAAIRGSITFRSRDYYYTILATGVSGQFVRKVKVVLKRDEYTAQLTPVLRQEL